MSAQQSKSGDSLQSPFAKGHSTLALPRLLHCPRDKECDSYLVHFGNQLIAQVDDPKNKYSFVGKYSCGHCHHDFHVCFPCSASFSNGNAKGNHCRLTHPKSWKEGKSGRIKRKRNAAQGPIVMVDDLDIHEEASLDSLSNYVDDASNDPPAGFQIAPTLLPTLQNRVALIPPNLFPYCTPASQKFFHHNQLPGGGISYLAGLAGLGLDSVANGEIDPLQVKMYAQTAQLAADLGITNRQRLADLTLTICEVVTKQAQEEEDDREFSFPVYPITDPAEMRSSIMEGNYAYLPNLPHPEAKECMGHAYCLPTDCLQDSLAFGHDLEYINPVGDGSVKRPPLFPIGRTSETPMCRRLFDINTVGTDDGLPIPPIDLYLWLTEWSDDFEPNDSVKSNRGSVWLKTLTVSPRFGSRHKLLHTYPLAIGGKKVDHEAVEILLSKNLLQLSSPGGVVMYSKRHGGLVSVRAKLFVSLQDQPERRGTNHLMAGNSTFHRRFGYSAPWPEFKDVLRPCLSCRQLLVDVSSNLETNECHECTNWAYDLKHPLLRFRQPHLPPIAYDATETPHDDLTGPMRLTFSGIIAAVHLTHDSYVAGDWDADKARGYLNRHCICTNTIKEIMSHADNCKQMRDVMHDPDATAEEREAVLQEATKHPYQWAPWPTPAVWSRGVYLVQHPDVPMHLLFLGVVKTVVQRVEEWMSNKGKCSAFLSEATAMLQGLEDLNLSWCKLQPFSGGKFGGWVSENFLGLSRVLKWLYSRLDEVATDKEPFVQPETPLKKWLAKDLKRWLQIRGLPNDGLKHENLISVSEYYKKLREEGEPLPCIVDEPAGPVRDVLLTLESLDDMIALLMVDSIEDDSYYLSVERSVRLFLTYFADMDDKLKRKSEVPSWLSSYNFLSLLNLPDIIREYGPLRLIWEGGSMGEGFLRFVKPNMGRGLRKGWERSTLQTLLREKALATIMWDELGPSSRLSGRLHEKLYHVYQNIIAIPLMLQRATLPLSVVGYEGGVYGIVANYNEEAKFLPIYCTDPGVTKCGLSYFQWFMGRESQETEYEDLETGRITSYLLLLPLLQGKMDYEDPGYQMNTFAAVLSNHSTITPV
jgi:hypothetical protein